MTATAACPKGLGHGTGVVKTDSCPKGGWCLVMLGWVGGQCSPCTLPSSGGMCPVLSTQQEAQSCGLHLGWLFWKDTGRRSFCFCPPNSRTWERKIPLLGSGVSGHLGASLTAELGTYVQAGFYWVFAKWIESQLGQFGLFFFFLFLSRNSKRHTFDTKNLLSNSQLLFLSTGLLKIFN